MAKMKIADIPQKVAVILLWGSLVVMALVTIIASSFSVLVADDYSHALSIGAFHVGCYEYLLAILRFVKQVYLNWQGTYFSMFLQALLSPLNNYGFLQLRIVMIVNALLFFVSFSWFILIAFHKVEKKNAWVKYMILAISCFMIVGYEAYPETFFWFSGATSYTFPLSFLFLSIAHLIKANNCGKIADYWIASFAGALAMGGSLTVVGMGCFMMLEIFLFFYLKEQKLNNKNVKVLAICLVAALVNVAAPGNYIRHEEIDSSGLHFMKTVLGTVIATEARWKNYTQNTNYVFLMLVVIIGGIILGSRIKAILKPMIIISTLSTLMPFITAFPVILGYSGNNYFPNRCAFVVDIAIIMSSISIAITMGAVLTTIWSNKRKIISIIAVMGLMCMMLDNYYLSDINLIHVSKEILNGTYSKHLEDCKQFDEAMNAMKTGSDVRINSKDFPQNIDNCYNLYISDDSEYWVNKSIASYYRLNSIAIIWEE